MHDVATRRQHTEFGLADLKDFGLPHLDEVMPSAMGRYSPARQGLGVLDERGRSHGPDRDAQVTAVILAVTTLVPHERHPGALRLRCSQARYSAVRA